MDIGLCLILVLLVPLITEIIIRRSSKAINYIKCHREKQKTISNMTIGYKTFTRDIKNEEDIDKVIEDLEKYIKV